MSGVYPPERRCARPRASRLSRSFRTSQPAEIDPPRPVAEFQTPSRLSRCRAVESPQQDSDCHQDIVWDAASPSPRRSGNRGKKLVARGVNIADIVSRIAPKHGRPTVTEPALQQWIGDSAAIPCTPDLQAQKPRKSPRPTVVDDLLKLARQFDLNMLGPDAVEPPPSPERHTDNPLEAVNHGTGVQLPEVDDLDFLFDGPTQPVSGRISQPSQLGPSAERQPLTSTALHGAEILEDWENDHLFNDSLVLEMTQNPEKFMSPIICSTQKPLTAFGQVKVQNPSPVKHFQPAAGTLKVSRRADRGSRSKPGLFQSTADKENMRLGTQIESNSELLPKRVPTNCGFNRFPDHRTESSLTTRDIMLDDLDALFSAEPLWDNDEDDDLLCQLCEDIERQIHPTDPASNQEMAPPRPFKDVKADTGNDPRGSNPCGGTVHLNTVRESVRFVREVSGTGMSMNPTKSNRVPTPTHRERFSFKKPNNPVSTITSTVSLRCSDAEIQLKKQQAMERRRQRMQAAPGWGRTGGLGCG